MFQNQASQGSLADRAVFFVDDGDPLEDSHVRMQLQTHSRFRTGLAQAPHSSREKERAARF